MWILGKRPRFLAGSYFSKTVVRAFFYCLPFLFSCKKLIQYLKTKL
jgi:hypothetical protein